ncbi:MAG: hypothetical protein HQL33_02970, partial [Alphaproteobacteria bacterium]|nr:hypothetical protein [Alphaproteobacteria bacterium]
MNITWIKNSSRKEALLLGVSALALFAAKPAQADTTVNAASSTKAANETGSVSLVTDHSLTVNDGVTIAGTVDNSGGGVGTGYLVFAGSSTLAGIVGSSNSLNSITAGVAASNVQFDSAIDVV